MRDISIHAPHEGERLNDKANANRERLFQSTLPTRGSDADAHAPAEARGDFNPRSPRGGATYTAMDLSSIRRISIHAPHEGERLCCNMNVLADVQISIHAPHEGERRVHAHHLGKRTRISIHAPHEGERPGVTRSYRGERHFNPRSPRGGATWCSRPVLTSTSPFQSTLPTRGSDLIS